MSDPNFTDPREVGTPAGEAPEGPRTEPAVTRPHGMTTSGRVRTTRAGAWWTALVVVAAVSILFLIFIAQNADPVTIRFLGLDGELSLAVALLLSAAIGALIVAIPGVARILQLRRALARNASER